MKILLIIFILVVPFQVNGDDLSGNKIACNEKTDEGISLTGFEFKDNIYVYVYTESNTSPQRIRYMKYKTSTSQIDISTQNFQLRYYVSRKNLEVKNQYNTTLYKSSNCELIKYSIETYFEKKLKKYKEGNLL